MGIHGQVVELGFGSGHNVPYYPAAATVPIDLLTDAGFTIAEVDVLYEKGSPKVVGAHTLGVAVSP